MFLKLFERQTIFSNKKCKKKNNKILIFFRKFEILKIILYSVAQLSKNIFFAFICWSIP